jgi:hypothetical protein
MAVCGSSRAPADLTGPTAGTIELPITMDWGPKRTYDMALNADRRVVYEVILQEAASTEQLLHVNGEALAEVWRGLWLPRTRPHHLGAASPGAGRRRVDAWTSGKGGVASVGLDVLVEYGFALAGGYALQAHQLSWSTA